VIPAVLATIAVVGLPILWIRRRYLVTTVDGQSMEPTLRGGDRLIVRRTRRVTVGQIVVVRPPDHPPPDHLVPGVPLTDEEVALLDAPPEPPAGRLMVKRVVATPGDRVPREGFPALRDSPQTVVPPGSLVVVGDNQDASWDSRDYGFVLPGHIVGVVVRRLAAAPGPA
jgi:signal peptidase I